MDAVAFITFRLKGKLPNSHCKVVNLAKKI